VTYALQSGVCDNERCVVENREKQQHYNPFSRPVSIFVKEDIVEVINQTIAENNLFLF
jgi:hypothetical protein